MKKRDAYIPSDRVWQENGVQHWMILVSMNYYCKILQTSTDACKELEPNRYSAMSAAGFTMPIRAVPAGPEGGEITDREMSRARQYFIGFSPTKGGENQQSLGTSLGRTVAASYRICAAKALESLFQPH
jgi:hypothetical protein